MISSEGIVAVSEVFRINKVGVSRSNISWSTILWSNISNPFSKFATGPLTLATSQVKESLLNDQFFQSLLALLKCWAPIEPKSKVQWFKIMLQNMLRVREGLCRNITTNKMLLRPRRAWCKVCLLWNNMRLSSQLQWTSCICLNMSPQTLGCNTGVAICQMCSKTAHLNIAEDLRFLAGVWREGTKLSKMAGVA